MQNPTSTYISQLYLLRDDLIILMEAWSSEESSFDAAVMRADAIAPLIAGQIQDLQNAQLPNTPNSMRLRSELNNLCNLMLREEERIQFKAYVAMVDSLISDGTASS